MSRNSITPPRVKFELHAYGEVYDFSNKSLANWKELEVSLLRDAVSGIYHQISFPFEFVLDAYDVVQRIFEKYQYRAVAEMYIYQLKDNWPYVKEQYYEPQIFNLDWTQYNKTDTKIEIDTKRTSLNDFIKAKNKILYDIPVSEIKADKPWNFERIELENSVKFRIASEYEKNGLGMNETTFPIATAHEASEVSIKDIIYSHTVIDRDKFSDDDWFAEMTDKAASQNVTIQANMSIAITSLITHPEWVVLKLMRGRNVDGKLVYDSLIEKHMRPNQGNIEWEFELNMDLLAGDKLAYALTMSRISGQYQISRQIDGYTNILYNARNEAEKIDTIDPKVLLQNLVDKMTNSKGIYTADIEDLNTDSQNLIMLSAAESIRGIQPTAENEAKVHTSHREFMEWMNAYGYEQHVVGNTLTFRKRHKGFRPDIVALELGEKECADLREYVNEEFLYTGLKIGYKKKDIENTNVRFEFNGTHDYGTDLNTGEKILTLISPYRADCYGIEFLAQERGKDTTDDKADKDLFIVNVAQGEEHYTTVQNVYEGNHPNQTLFNGSLNPYNLMLLNKSLLAVSVEQLTFAASDCNSKIVIDQQRIDQSYSIPPSEKLFEPIIYDIASRNIQHLPLGEDVNGIVRFRYKGQTYEGYISQISKNMTWEMETTWILYKKKG